MSSYKKQLQDIPKGKKKKKKKNQKHDLKKQSKHKNQTRQGLSDQEFTTTMIEEYIKGYRG